MTKQLKRFKSREPRPVMILRLLAEAEAGIQCRVTIPDALEFRRDQYGLTKSEFAALLGLALSHYGEILSGKRGIGKTAMRRAYAIGVPADVLLQPEKAVFQPDNTKDES